MKKYLILAISVLVILPQTVWSASKAGVFVSNINGTASQVQAAGFGYNNRLCHLRGTGISQADVVSALAQGHSYQITQPGYYCLTGNIRVNAVPANLTSVIGINAPFVTSTASTTMQYPLPGQQSVQDIKLDLNGFTLEFVGTGVKPNGINIEGDNITITNGQIAGFRYGIQSYSAARLGNNRVVSHVWFKKNERGALFLSDSLQAEVRFNHFKDSGVGDSGIVLLSAGYFRVEDNDIELSPNQGTGIIILHAENAFVSRNKITFSIFADSNRIRPYGIYLSSVGGEISNNFIRNVRNGIGINNLGGQGQNSFRRIIANKIYAGNEVCEKIYLSTGRGILSNGNAVDISNNELSGPFAPAIENFSLSSGTIHDNRIYQTPLANAIVNRSGARTVIGTNYIHEICPVFF